MEILNKQNLPYSLAVIALGVGFGVGKYLDTAKETPRTNNRPNPRLSDKVILGYWNIRGLAQPIRYLLEYTEARYEDRHEKREEWFKEKENRGFDFPNLPYLIDGDLKISQSSAILHYIGRKYDLLGADEKEQAAVDQLLGVLGDLNSDTSKFVYGTGTFEEGIKKYEEEVLNPYLRRLETYLQNKTFIIGRITIADFVLYERLDVTLLMIPGKLDSYPKLKSYKERMDSLPAISKYRQSPRFIERPVNGPSAIWK